MHPMQSNNRIKDDMTNALVFVAVAIGLLGVMALAWAVARRPGKSGWGDAIWTFAAGAASAVLALAPVEHAWITFEPSGRQGLVAVLVLVWSGRLGLHIARRSSGGHDDPRYAELRRLWGEAYSRRLFWFFQIQAVAAWPLAISVMAAARGAHPFPAWSDWAGMAIVVLALAGEALADHQLVRFRRDPRNRDQVCAEGLWGLSRHPNYFFEWLVWIGFFVIAVGPHFAFGAGWVALSAPLVMYVLLVHVSGIPPLEAHMLRSRGEAFARTQARISKFWPLPRPQPEGARR